MNTWTPKRIKACKDVWLRADSRSITKRRPAGGGDGFVRLTSFAPPPTSTKDVTAAGFWEPKRLPSGLRELYDQSDVVSFRSSKDLIHEAASPDAKDTIPIPQAGRRSPRLAQATAADDRAAFLPRNQLGLERSQGTRFIGNVRSSQPLTAKPSNTGSNGIGREGAVLKPRHSNKPLTQQAPLRPSTDARATKRVPSSNRSRDKDEMYKPFKARPMPSSTKQSIGVGKGHKSVSLMEARPFPLMMSEERGRDKQALPAQRLLAQQKQAKPSNAGSNGTGREGARAVLKPRHSNKPLTQQAPFRPSTDARATKRVPSPNRSRDKDEMYKPFKARPMPSSTKQSIGVGKGHKSVSLMEARPFPLMSEERGRAKQALPAQRLLAQQKQDEAATSFRARPLPAPSKGFAPRRSERPPTEVREFRLSSRTHDKCAEVHALPPPVATFEHKPCPQRTKVPLTQPVEMTLRSSEARAGERRRWDMKNRARLDAAERRRLEEKEAVAELRRRPIEEGGMAFKAKPITRSSAPTPGKNRPRPPHGVPPPP